MRSLASNWHAIIAHNNQEHFVSHIHAQYIHMCFDYYDRLGPRLTLASGVFRCNWVLYPPLWAQLRQSTSLEDGIYLSASFLNANGNQNSLGIQNLSSIVPAIIWVRNHLCDHASISSTQANYCLSLRPMQECLMLTRFTTSKIPHTQECTKTIT